MGQALFPSRVRGVGLVGMGVGLIILLLGCTFWVQLPEGPVVRVTLPDDRVREFIAKMDRLTSRLLEETRRTGDPALRRLAEDFRALYYRWLQRMGRSSPADPLRIAPLKSKLLQFERALEHRLSSSGGRARYREVQAYFHLLRWELEQFLRTVRRAADP